jgi:hypothetical protein
MIVFVISMDKRKDVIANSEGTGTQAIIREWMAMMLLVMTILVFYWMICFIVNTIVLTGINKVYKANCLKKELANIETLIAHQNSKELKGISQLTEKAIGNYITDMFSYGFRERGPKEKIVIEKGLEMEQNYRITQIDEIDVNNIEVKKVKARKFGKDFAENLVKKYKAEEKMRVEWYEGEELDQDDAVISQRWHRAVNKLFKKNIADSNTSKSNPAGQNN